MKKILIVVALAGGVAGAFFAGASLAQPNPSLTQNAPAAMPPAGATDSTLPPAVATNPTTEPVPNGFPLYRSGISIQPSSSSPYFDRRYVATSNSNKLQELMRQLHNTEDAAKKTELMKQMESAVTEAFEEDMKRRDADLVKLEERVKKLRTQLDRRRTAKAEIIQLQLKVLANDADGLGFSSRTESDHLFLYPISAAPQTQPFLEEPAQNPPVQTVTPRR